MHVVNVHVCTCHAKPHLLQSISGRCHKRPSIFGTFVLIGVRTVDNLFVTTDQKLTVSFTVLLGGEFVI